MLNSREGDYNLDMVQEFGIAFLTFWTAFCRMTLRGRMRAATILDSLGLPSSSLYCTVKRPFAAAVTVPARHRSLLRVSCEDVSGELPSLSTYTFLGVVCSRRGGEGREGLFRGAGLCSLCFKCFF